MKDAGQAMARLLRAQPGCDESGAEHAIDTGYAPLKELGAGELEAEDGNQHGFLLGQPGNMLGSYHGETSEARGRVVEDSNQKTQELRYVSRKNLGWRYTGTQPAADML